MCSAPQLQSTSQEAKELLDVLKGSFNSQLYKDLNESSVVQALLCPKTHKVHPLIYQLKRGGLQNDPCASQVLANQERALKACLRDLKGDAHAWAKEHLNLAGDEKNIANASSMLAENRAFGYLWEAGCTVIPVRVGRGPTEDFRATYSGDSFGVEVHCKQMNQGQSSALAVFNAGPPGTHSIFPAGKPRPKETTAENVASKFAGIKPGASQASASIPSIIWLDLQDEDWWILDGSYAQPIVVSQQLYFSSGLWHAVYGKKGIPIFEYHTTEPMGLSGVPTMGHDGLFIQHPIWSAAVIGFPRATVAFENPNPVVPLTDEIRKCLCLLPWFDFVASRMNWPPGSRILQDSIRLDEERLTNLSKIAVYHW
jgi:hypothetical protein